MTRWRRKLATVTKCSLYVLQCSAGVRIKESSDTDEHRNECAEMRGNFWSLCWCVGWHQTGEWSAEGIAEASSGAVLCLTKVSDIWARTQSREKQIFFGNGGQHECKNETRE